MPMPESAIREIVATYLAATYAIRLPGGRRVVLRIGARTPPELDALLDAAARDRDVRHARNPDAGAADPIDARAIQLDLEAPGECAYKLVEAAAPGAGAGLITAWNPFSQTTPHAENRARQHELLACLRPRARSVLAASGYGAGWREPGFAAFAIETQALDGLARAFRQNAIVTLRAGACVRLRLYRDDWRDALADSDVDLAPPALG
jgi:hypothetical protein